MIEIQIVPSDIRRNVRYVFMDRRRVMAAICVLTVVLAAIIGSMAAAPTVIRKVYKDNYVKSMRVESDIQRERCHAVEETSTRSLPSAGGPVTPSAAHGIRASAAMRGWSAPK